MYKIEKQNKMLLKHLFIILAVVLIYFLGRSLYISGYIPGRPRCGYSMLCSTLICETVCSILYLKSRPRAVTGVVVVEFFVMCAFGALAMNWFDVVGIVVSMICYSMGIHDLKSLKVLNEEGNELLPDDTDDHNE